MNDEGDWSESERHALAGERRDVSPPADAERRILAALRRSGAVQPRRSTLGWVAAAAALAIAFAGGAWSQQLRSHAVRSDSPRFILLLYGGESGDADRRREYASWARSTSHGGVVVDGEELGAEERELPEQQPPTVITPAPRGYFVVSASTLQEAWTVAASCPHLKHGGRIVVRPLVSP
jgi:hypothetical protein